MIALEDLSNWFQKYPIFPDELKFENCFTYIDKVTLLIQILVGIINKISNSEIFICKIFATALIEEIWKVIDCYVIKTSNEIENPRVIDAIKSTNFTSPK